MSNEMVWSFSRVSCYDNCPRCFDLCYNQHVDKKDNAFAQWGTASFIYNPKAHNFHCFGCGCNVDIIDAYIKCGKTYIEAVEQLFNEAGIPYSFAERGVHSSADYRYPKPEYAGNKDKVYEYWRRR